MREITEQIVYKWVRIENCIIGLPPAANNSDSNR
jgi:hypothetical protein